MYVILIKVKNMKIYTIIIFLVILVFSSSCKKEKPHFLMTDACFTMSADTIYTNDTVVFKTCDSNFTYQFWSFGNGEENDIIYESDRVREFKCVYNFPGNYIIKQNIYEIIFGTDNIKKDSVSKIITVIDRNINTENLTNLYGNWQSTEYITIDSIPHDIPDTFRFNTIISESYYNYYNDEIIVNNFEHYFPTKYLGTGYTLNKWNNKFYYFTTENDWLGIYEASMVFDNIANPTSFTVLGKLKWLDTSLYPDIVYQSFVIKGVKL